MSRKKLVTAAQVSVDSAWKTPQFWFLWVVLCTNVTAGIGVLAQASPMAQDMFGVSAAAAGGFVGLLSIFNMAGRFFWSSYSEVIGRKGAFCIYFVLGCVLYLLIPYTQKRNSVTFFVAVAAVIISMYGGGFATTPAYLRDIFGTMRVGRHPRSGDHGLVDGSRIGTAISNQSLRFSKGPRCTEGGGLQYHYVSDGRTHLQSIYPRGRPQVPL